MRGSNRSPRGVRGGRLLHCPAVGASWTPLRSLTLYANYLTGNNVSNGQSLRELETGVIYQLTVNASITLLYRDLQMAAIDQLNLYQAKLNYSF